MKFIRSDARSIDARHHRCALLLMALLGILGATGAARQSPPDAPAKRSLPDSPSAPVEAPAPPKSPELHAKVTTARGVFRFVMHAKEAPLAVTNFCNLARKGFFDGLPVFAKTFVMRATGRPSTGFNAGWTFRCEYSPKLTFDEGGVVAMGTMGEGSNLTSHPTEWFATVKAQERWTLTHPIFGTVTEGLNVVYELAPGDLIERVEIEGDPTPLFEKYATLIAKWDSALAKSGWKSGAVAPAPPPAPPTVPVPPAPPSTPASPPSTPPSPSV